jgi:transposase-like protein
MVPAYPVNNPIYQDDLAARRALEELRWPNGPQCIHADCGAPKERVVKLGGATGAKTDGLYRCNDCRRQFTVTVGTFFDHSRIPLSLWLRALHMLSARNAPTIADIERQCGITNKTATKMWKRIRTALDSYRGTATKFGGKVQEYLTGKAPKLPDFGKSPAHWYKSRDRLREQGRIGDPQFDIEITGVFRKYATAHAVDERDGTERLARLLIASEPVRVGKPRSSAKWKSTPRRHSPTDLKPLRLKVL